MRGEETAVQARRTIKELVEQLNNTGMEGKIMAIRLLPSGDALLTMDDEGARSAWLKDTKWLTVFGQNARVKRRGFTIVAHGVKVSGIRDQARVKSEIYAQNPRLRNSVEILWVAPSKKLLNNRRTMGALCITIAEPEQASLIIEHGLVWNYQIYDCEPYAGDSVTQCFRCYGFGHIARMCRNIPKCGFCADPGHHTNDCTVKEYPAKHQCVSCGEGSNHASWARECPVHRRQMGGRQFNQNVQRE
jgi:hypothetical protein